MSQYCRKCHAPASQLCSRCQNVSYCSRECQAADWSRHKRMECTMMKQEPILDVVDKPNFSPEPFFFCLRCGKHFKSCGCEGLKNGEDLIFVMDPIPDHYTFMQRIHRWAKLVKCHPTLRRFDAMKFIEDFPESFEEDLMNIQPYIRALMEKYKATELMEVATIMGIQSKEGFDQCHKDCNFVMEHFFKGNWGYLANIEYSFLSNAIQMSPPDQFEPDIGQKIGSVFSTINVIMEAFARLGNGNLNYRLEDIRGNGSSN